MPATGKQQFTANQFKNAFYVKGIFQYHVTHDISVYAIRWRNGD